MRAQNTKAAGPAGAGLNAMANALQPEHQGLPVNGIVGNSYGAVQSNSGAMPGVFAGPNQQNMGLVSGQNGHPVFPMNDYPPINAPPHGNHFGPMPPPFPTGMQHVGPFVPIPNPMEQPGQFPVYGPSNVQGGPSQGMPQTGAWQPINNFGLRAMANIQQSQWMTNSGNRGPLIENNMPVQLNPGNPLMSGAVLPGNQAGNVYPRIHASAVFPWYRNGPTYELKDMRALISQHPIIPTAVTAMWTNSTQSLAKCLENREGTRNVYIRGFRPETTDQVLTDYGKRFGKIEKCKAIVDLDTGRCKGYGFIQFRDGSSCENAIRAFHSLGYQASYAQKSRNARLKDLEDKTSTNIYCTNIPVEWTEAELREHFKPFTVASDKIIRDEATGVSRQVGFARFETREIAEKVLEKFHNKTVEHDNVKLLLRFADTKEQKQLKRESNQRRAYRAGEYNYSVGVLQGATPSPDARRQQPTSAQVTPESQQSANISPEAQGSSSSNWTRATSVSPSFAAHRRPINRSARGGPGTQSLSALEDLIAMENAEMAAMVNAPAMEDATMEDVVMEDAPPMEVIETPVNPCMSRRSGFASSSTTARPNCAELEVMPYPKKGPSSPSS